MASWRTGFDSQERQRVYFGCSQGNPVDSARVASTVPPQLKMTPLSDQSIFVRAAVQGVIREAVIAAGLTAIMILVFLGSWRSTLIIAISIPLSILSSVIILGLIGETINTMTLAPGVGRRYSG